MNILKQRIKELESDNESKKELLEYINEASDEILGVSKGIAEDTEEIMEIEEALRKLEAFDKIEALPKELKEQSISQDNEFFYSTSEYGCRVLVIMMEHSNQVIRDLSNH